MDEANEPPPAGPASGPVAAASRFAAWVATAPVRRRFRTPAGAREVVIPTADGLRLAAWCFEPSTDEGPARGTVVVAHGWRDDRRQLAGLAPIVGAAGLRTLAFDFRAHGASEGDRITIGVREALDVAAALDAAAALGGVVGFVGFSMGAAAYLLAGREAAAAVLDSPYDTLHEAVGSRLDRFRIPRPAEGGIARHGQAMARRIETDLDAVRPIDGVAALTRPTLFVFAERDWWISAATRGRFRAALPPCGVMEELAEGGHRTHLTPEWRRRVGRWLGAALGGVTAVRGDSCYAGR